MGTAVCSLFEPFWQIRPEIYFLALGGMILQVFSLIYFLWLIFQRVRAPLI